MKRRSTIIILFSISLVVTLYIYEAVLVLPILSINKLRITNALIDDSNLNSLRERYGINKEDLERIDKSKNTFRYVIVTCSCKNESFIKEIDDAKFKFENIQELPKIIVSTHPETGLLTPVNIKPRKTANFGVSILIDAENYNDKEIMEMLKEVKITMISDETGEVRTESRPMSLDSEIK